MKILIYLNKKYSHTQFFCVRCLKVRSSEGDNLKRHPRVIRFLGIVLRYPYGDSIIETPIELIETHDFTLGGVEMSDIIEKQMNNLQIQRHKWLSLASDGAVDMEKIAHILDLAWDRCIIHLLNLMVQKFWQSSLER